MPIPAVNQIVGSKGQFLGTPPTTADQQNATAVSEFNARFYQLGIRGYLFHYGISNTALVAANAIATGVTATAQPVPRFSPTRSMNEPVKRALAA